MVDSPLIASEQRRHVIARGVAIAAHDLQDVEVVVTQWVSGERLGSQELRAAGRTEVPCLTEKLELSCETSIKRFVSRNPSADTTIV